MKSEKGVTLMSLATYIVLMLIVIAILTTVSMNFQSNLKQINEQGTEVSEISKFNMYFLQEVKKQEPTLKDCFLFLGNHRNFDKRFIQGVFAPPFKMSVNLFIKGGH